MSEVLTFALRANDEAQAENQNLRKKIIYERNASDAIKAENRKLHQRINDLKKMLEMNLTSFVDFQSSW